MKKVYVTQVPGRLIDKQWAPSVDVTPAKEFGELVFMMPIGRSTPDAKAAMQQLSEHVRTFKPDDYLLMLGDPIIIATAAAMIAQRWQVIRLLKWDKRMKRYFEFTLDLSCER